MIRSCSVIIAALISVFSLAFARAESGYPSHPIKLIVSQGPGSTVDLAARMLATKFEELFRYQIIVLNREGAAGEIAKKECAAASADGYTLCIIADGQAAVIPASYSAAKEPIPGADVSPIGFIGTHYFEFVVRKDLPDSFAGFVEYARKNPDTLVCGSANPSGILGMAILNGISGVKVREARYRQAEPLVHLDIRAGHIDCMFSTTVTALPHLKDGAIRALGTLGPLKNPFLPDTLPLSEQGQDYAAFGKFGSWQALWGPPELPGETVAILNKNLNKILDRPEVADRLAQIGITVRRSSTPEQLRAATDSLFLTVKELLCAHSLQEPITLNGRSCKR